MKNDDFYIGYHAKAPAGVATTMRMVVAGMLTVVILLGMALVMGHQTLSPSTFEFLEYRSFEGTLSEHPYPTLRVQRPGIATVPPTHSQYHLVSAGKFGAQDAVAGLDGQQVRLQGALIYRDDQTMIEVLPGSIEPLTGPPQDGMSQRQSLGTHTLNGEIVDSKCFLGVMNPGHLKPHRACAVRCISGGMPPVLAVRTASGETSYYLLVSSEGGSVNKDILGMVAEPVAITGEVIQQDNLMILHADPSTYQRIDS